VTRLVEDVVRQVATGAPFVEEPVIATTELVVAVAESVLPPVPVLDEYDAQPSKPVGAQWISPSAVEAHEAGEAAPAALTPTASPTSVLVLGDLAAPATGNATARDTARPARGGTPAAPWPAQESGPLPPTAPPTAPTGGAGPGSTDAATTSSTVVVLRPGPAGRVIADWHVPQHLPDRPGTRPG
jgi:hypothetical protein